MQLVSPKLQSSKESFNLINNQQSKSCFSMKHMHMQNNIVSDILNLLSSDIAWQF
jgi:hypothetical protein